MKSFLLSVLVLISLSLQAQVLDRPTIASGGSYFKLESNITIQSTLGELAVETIRFANVTLTQGFQQPELKIKSSSPQKEEFLSALKIYPNPVADQIKIHFEILSPTLVSMTLFDRSGKMVDNWVQFCEAGNQDLSHNVQVPPDFYFLVLSYNGYSSTTKVIVE